MASTLLALLLSLSGSTTGRRFNSVSAIEDRPDGKTNPMVNPGAMATTSMAPGGNTEEKWRFLQQGLSRFAGRELSIDQETFASARRPTQLIAPSVTSLRSYNRLAAGSEETVDLYTRQSCLRVTARDLAMMAATSRPAG